MSLKSTKSHLLHNKRTVKTLVKNTRATYKVQSERIKWLVQRRRRGSASRAATPGEEEKSGQITDVHTIVAKPRRQGKFQTAWADRYSQSRQSRANPTLPLRLLRITLSLSHRDLGSLSIHCCCIGSGFPRRTI